MKKKLKLGFALTGSFCTFDKVINILEKMQKTEKYDITAILSENSQNLDTKFGNSKNFINKIKEITGKEIINTIQKAEPIGPKKFFDILIIAPCTGNTLSKLSNSITDGTVTMAAKSHLRREKPIILAISTNDGLSGSAENIGRLLNRRNYYFVPFGQDLPDEKPRSIVANMDLIPQTIEYATKNKQIQPILLNIKN